MNKVRFITLLACVVMMSFLLAACNDSDDDPVSTTTIPVGVMGLGKDVIIGSSTGTGLNTSGISYAVFVKKADSYTDADLEGTWYYKDLWVSTTDMTDVSIGGDVRDLTTSAIDHSTGEVDITVAGSTVHAYMGASKEIIVAASYDDDGDSDGDPDGVGLIVFIKTGSGYDYDTDLLGNWYEESVWHANPADDYAVVDEKGDLVFGASGVFSADITEYPDEISDTASGTATLVGSTVTITGDIAISGLMSAGKDVFAVVDDTDDVGMLIALKQGDSYDISEFEGSWYGAILSISSDESDYWAESQWETITYQGSGQDVTVDWENSEGSSDTETYSDYELTVSDEGLISIVIDTGSDDSGSGQPL